MVCQKLSRSTPGSPPARTGDRGEKLGGREEGTGAWLLLGQENEGRKLQQVASSRDF